MSFSLIGGRRRKRSHRRRRRGGNVVGAALRKGSVPLTLLALNNYLGKKIIMGRSLGCASALEIVSNYQKYIDACIIESGFIDELPIFKLFNITPGLSTYIFLLSNLLWIAILF